MLTHSVVNTYSVQERAERCLTLNVDTQVKGKGNKLLLAKDYEGAEACYSEALELSPDGPNSHVYLCNRAAALCYLGRHDDAVVDCQESLELNPRYAKAHTRLGYAYFQVQYDNVSFLPSSLFFRV